MRWGKGVSGMWTIPAGVLWDSCGQEWKALLSSLPQVRLSVVSQSHKGEVIGGAIPGTSV